MLIWITLHDKSGCFNPLGSGAGLDSIAVMSLIDEALREHCFNPLGSGAGSDSG